MWLLTKEAYRICGPDITLLDEVILGIHLNIPYNPFPWSAYLLVTV